MAIAWTRENVKERTFSGKNGESYVLRRSFMVRTDDPSQSPIDVVGACGVVYGDEHPDYSFAVMKSFDCKPADDSGLLYAVSFEYSAPDLKDTNSNPGASDDKIPTWSASSSVTTGPVTKDIDGNPITNSAGDPLEGVEMEKAEFRLTLTQYFPDHTVWAPGSREYTNTLNNAAWNGGEAGEWKCQGSSAKLNIDNSDGAVAVYWEVNIEFAYRKGGWDPVLLDMGFAERCDGDGNPTSGGDQRRQIKGQDGKPVRQPVALIGGVAAPAGVPPDLLTFHVYERKDFSTPFGQLYTPTV